MSLLRSISYIPYRLPTAPHPVDLGPTCPYGQVEWVGALGGLGGARVCCSLVGPVMLFHSAYPSIKVFGIRTELLANSKNAIFG